MNEIREVPFDGPDDESSNIAEEEPNGNGEESTEEKIRKREIWFNQTFGRALLILGSLILLLTVLSYPFHPSQSDPVALWIEQLLGFILSGISLIFGSLLLFGAYRLKKRKDYVYEPINDPMENDIED
ncbi:MAG: hypothetical protein GF308_12100 [Candidatus Heimdallarchaeota archaeon]|nr:hypothetical protein [Candidatus Heimdallarchaeota archaeon]